VQLADVKTLCPPGNRIAISAKPDGRKKRATHRTSDTTPQIGGKHPRMFVKEIRFAKSSMIPANNATTHPL
jgi:hypothetical protein